MHKILKISYSTYIYTASIDVVPLVLGVVVILNDALRDGFRRWDVSTIRQRGQRRW